MSTSTINGDSKVGDVPVGKSTLVVSSTNLLKNCVGAGVFSLNAKVTNIFPNLVSSPSNIIRVAIMIYTMAVWGAYNFYLLGETCRLTESTNYSEAWSKTVSTNSRFIVQTIVTIAPIIGCLANIIVLHDVLKLLLQVIGMPISYYSNRVLVIATLSCGILYPICTLKDLSALKSVSVLGLAGQLAAMSAFAVRLFDKSYLPTGKYFATSILGKTAQAVTSSSATAATALASKSGLSKWFVLASLLSYCYTAHYNAPRYYNELDGKQNDSLLFFKMSLLSYVGAATFYFSTIILATKLFGKFSAPFALNSFSPSDPLALVSLLAFGMSVLASTPLMFLTARNWFIQQSAKTIPAISDVKPMTAIVLFLISALASKLTDIGKVGSVAGAMFGTRTGIGGFGTYNSILALRK
eukprot:gene12274-16460_t